MINLVQKYKGSERTITADNYFSSIPLATKLLSLDLFYVGTLRKNKKEIPPEFKETKVRYIKKLNSKLIIIYYIFIRLKRVKPCYQACMALMEA